MIANIVVWGIMGILMAKVVDVFENIFGEKHKFITIILSLLIIGTTTGVLDIYVKAEIFSFVAYIIGVFIQNLISIAQSMKK